jgi:hypothetical protein
MPRMNTSKRFVIIVTALAVGWIWLAHQPSSAPSTPTPTPTPSAPAEETLPWYQTLIGRANAVAYRLNCGPLSADAERLVMTPMEGVTHLSAKDARGY